MNEKDNLLRHIKNLLEMVADDSATIARQAAQLEQYAKMLDDERAEIAQLRAQLDAVPIAQLRRQYSIEPMTVHDFGLDAQDVDAWLRSLDGDA